MQLTRGDRSRCFATSALGAAILVLLFLPGRAQACSWVCVIGDNYERMLRDHQYVLVGRAKRGPDGFTNTVTAVRVWKGNRKQIKLTNGPCGAVRDGRLYVVFAERDFEEVTPCSAVFGLWEKPGKLAMTRLDRLRGFPALSVPAEDLLPQDR